MIVSKNKLSSKCAFIIVTYNSKNDISECIISIKSFHPECGIYVIDNNSSDGTKEILQSIEGIELILLPVNSGYPGGNNLGLKKAIESNYEYFFLFNPDARLNQKIIEPLIKLNIRTNGLIGPVIRDFYTGKIQSIGGTFNPFFSHFYVSKKETSKDKELIRVEWILGASLLISRKIINKCGFLDENFFPASLEDSSYCIEAKKRGINSYINLRTYVIHKGGTSSGGDKKYLLRILKNRFYYALTYQNTLFFLTTIIESSLRYIYHKIFGVLKKNKVSKKNLK